MRLPAARPAWFIRPLWWWQQHRHGTVLEPTALWSWRPAALLAFLGLFGLLRRARSPVPARTRALASVRVSQLVNCAFCIDLNAAALGGAQAAAVLDQVADWRNAATFTPVERLALEYAEAMSATPPAVGEELMTRLRAVFTPQAIVELTAVIAMQNLSARFNNALDTQTHGFCPWPAPAVRATPPPP